jgi:radical SAM superfamily enzyme YgiQ (UPF0313 family)
MEKVILLNPPSNFRCIRDFYCSFSSKAQYYWPPQDLICLSGILRDHFVAELIDAVSNSIDEDRCLEIIEKSPAKAVISAIGALTFDSDIRFLCKVKAKTGKIIIGSSSIFCFMGEEIMLKYPVFDALITDFTDKSIIKYLNGEFSGCNLTFRAPEGIRIPERRESGDFNIGVAQQESFINRRNRIPFFGDSDFATVISSVGCKFRCAFCVAGTMNWRGRDLNELIEELKHIENLGVKKVFFADPLFTADKNRVSLFCSMMKELKIKQDWICNAHAVTISDYSMLTEMKESGCVGIMIGAESASDNILKRYDKRTDTKQLEAAVNLCKKAGIKTLAYFIIGLPGENRDSIKDTIGFSRKLGCDYASFGFATPDVGTRLLRECQDNQWLRQPYVFSGIDSSKEPAIITDELSKDELKQLMRLAYRKFYLRPGYILNKIKEIRGLDDLRFLFKEGIALLKKNSL